MILIIGGIASGKRTFVHSLGYVDADFSNEVADGKPVLIDAQELVRDPTCELEELAGEIAAAKQVVVLVDVGSGIVPMEREERVWRDDVGHLGGFLAAKSEVVVRMVCGIPIAVKGKLPEEAQCR